MVIDLGVYKICQTRGQSSVASPLWRRQVLICSYSCWTIAAGQSYWVSLPGRGNLPHLLCGQSEVLGSEDQIALMLLWFYPISMVSLDSRNLIFLIILLLCQVCQEDGHPYHSLVPPSAAVLEYTEV